LLVTHDVVANTDEFSVDKRFSLKIKGYKVGVTVPIFVKLSLTHLVGGTVLLLSDAGRTAVVCSPPVNTFKLDQVFAEDNLGK
jgi:hypothetical protein